MADKDLELWITPDKKIRVPFGAPEPVIQSFKFTRKVVFGKDILGEMRFHVTREDILLNVIKEFPSFYRLQLTRAPMTYDIEDNCDLLDKNKIKERLDELKNIGKEAIPISVLDDESIKRVEKILRNIIKQKY